MNKKTPVYYSPDYLAGSEDIETWQKSGHIARSLQRQPIAGVEIKAPKPATLDELRLAHSDEFIFDVLYDGPLGGSAGFGWVPELPAAVRASTGGVLRAVDEVMCEGGPLIAGSLSSGLHHARRDHGEAFCTFNGVALAALYAKRVKRVPGRVLIIDTDAHCGGGTHSIITGGLPSQGASNIDQTDLSVSPLDCHHNEGWPEVEAYDPDIWQARNRPTIPSVPRWARGQHAALVDVAEDYLPTLEAMLAARNPDDYGLVIYNAGMDPHEDCAVGGLHDLTTAELQARERMVFEWCRVNDIPTVFVMAGGYVSGSLNWNRLVHLHRLTIETAAQKNAKRVNRLDVASV